MEEPKQGKWGLWYANGTGHATKEEALKSIQEGKGAGRLPSGPSPLWRWAVLGCVALLLGWAGKYWWDTGAEDRARAAQYQALKDELDQSRRDSLLLCQNTIKRLASYGKASGPRSKWIQNALHL